jgi:hypothetical protein
MTIERTNNEIIFRLPNNINLDDLQDFADYFQYRTIANKSKASQTEVDNLVKEIKKGRWDKTRKQLEFMRVVVDTNIAFSAILNTNSKIGKILLHPKSKINFYSTNNLKLELEKHKVKLKKLSGYSEQDFHNIFTLVLSKIRFINTRRPFKNGR